VFDWLVGWLASSSIHSRRITRQPAAQAAFHLPAIDQTTAGLQTVLSVIKSLLLAAAHKQNFMRLRPLINIQFMCLL
jgi:hypothetical protein